MNRLLRRAGLFLREAAYLQLLIALESGESEVLVGGQAVMEGVMMRAPHSYAVAVRRPDGTIVTTTRALTPVGERRRYWRWPVLRGLAKLGQASVLGVRALRFSGVQTMQDGGVKAESKSAGEVSDAAEVGPAEVAPAEVGPWSLALGVGFSLVFFIAMYKFVPLLAATRLQRSFPALHGQIAFNLVDGLIRIAIFLAIVGGMALVPDIRRLYQYHGAEHKVVFNFESGQPVDIAHARRFTSLHPRCGTSFMIVVMLLAMFSYMAIPVHTFAARLLVRLALLPLVAGLAFEVIYFSARHSQSLFALLARPGLWLQRITTQEPADDQLECSIQALQAAMELERTQGGRLIIS